jgi:hypothetical protein
METERILRSSVWLNDSNDINIEIIWEKRKCQSGEETLKGVARLCLSVEEASNLHDKLHHTLMTSLRSSPRPKQTETT